MLRAFFLFWLFLALVAGKLLLLQRLPLSALAGLLLGLTALVLLAYRRVAAFRRWADGIDLRVVVALHATRLVGFYFVHLHGEGLLPRALAVPGGLSHGTVGLLALIVALVPLSEPVRRHAIAVWNVVGLIDLALLLLAAGRLGFAEPASLAEFAHLPLSLLPTFLIPLLLASHVLIFQRLGSKTE